MSCRWSWERNWVWGFEFCCLMQTNWYCKTMLYWLERVNVDPEIAQQIKFNLVGVVRRCSMGNMGSFNHFFCYSIYIYIRNKWRRRCSSNNGCFITYELAHGAKGDQHIKQIMHVFNHFLLQLQTSVLFSGEATYYYLQYEA